MLDNASIRNALANHLNTHPLDNSATTTTPHITPVRCHVDIHDQSVKAIIDSGAAISMISHDTVKQLGLTIEKPSKNLIMTAAGTSTRPLGVITNLPITINGYNIPLDVEVVPVKSYSLLLGNDWNSKVEANYSWKNGCYTLRWKGKKLSLQTTYETDRPLLAKPTITDTAELEQFEQEFLSPKEAYASEVESIVNSKPWQTVTQPPHHPPQRKLYACGNCKTDNHQFENCIYTNCNRCYQTGHIAAYCPMQTPRRNSCRTCQSTDHFFWQCPNNTCHGCSELGHITARCPLTNIKAKNLLGQCGCNPEDIEAR